MKIVIESKSKVSQNTPANENCHRVQIRGVPEYSPKWKLSGSPNLRCPRILLPQLKLSESPNPRCPRILPSKMKIVRESKSEVSQNTLPKNENWHRVQIQGVPKYIPKMKIVRESKSEVFQNTPENENCQGVQIQGVPELPAKWKLSLDLNSMTIFIWGEYSGTPWIWTLWQFSFWGDILWHLGFGLYDNFHWGRVLRDTLDLDSMTIFILGGSSGTPWIWTPWQFSFSGVFWNTSDLDSLTIFILGIYFGTPWIWTLWQFSFLGRVFWYTSDFDSLTIFILGGSILGHLGFGLSDNFNWGRSILGHLRFGLPDNFHFGEYSGTPRIWTLWQFSFVGVFWDTLDLDSMTIFIYGGYSGTPQIWILWQFSFFGGILEQLGFGLSYNIHLGVFWDTSDLDSLTIFIWGEYSGTPWVWTLWQFSFGGAVFWDTLVFWLPDNFHFGGYLEHLGFGLYDNFHWGGYSGTPRIWTLWKFSFEGVFWDTSDLDSLTIFILGYSGTPWIWTLSQLQLGGSILWHLGFGFYDNFHLGGYSGTPWIWTLWQFSLGGSILGHLRFGLSDNIHLGVFWDTSDLDSMTIFIWGEYSGIPWIFILWQFSFWRWSILGHPFFWLPENFHFGGIWNTSDLDSMTIFISGGYSGTPWIWTLWQFSFRGILGHLGFGFYDNFHFGAYSGTPWIWTLWQFSFGGSILGHLVFGLYDNFHFEGGFWDTSDLDSLTIFIWGFSGTPQIWTVWQFSFRGSI